jgi:integrase
MFLSPDEFQRLVSCIREGWLKDIVYFAVLTGMRRGEIFNLQWEQVDLARRLVNIQSRETWKSKQGKRRTIPLSELAANIIASREGKSPSPFVFSHKDGKIDEDWASHVFKRYVRRAGLPNQRLRFHSLRHTFSTWLVQSGVSLAEVQKLLGHSSIAVTEVYAHLQTKNLHSSVNLIRLN